MFISTLNVCITCTIFIPHTPAGCGWFHLLTKTLYLRLGLPKHFVASCIRVMNHWTIATMQDCYCIRLLTKHSLLLAVSNCSYTRDTNLWTFPTLFELTCSQSSPDLTQASANDLIQFFKTLPQSSAITLAHKHFILTVEVNWSWSRTCRLKMESSASIGYLDLRNFWTLLLNSFTNTSPSCIIFH